MIVVDRKTKQVVSCTGITPERMQKAQEQILIAHVALHPELLKTEDVKDAGQ